MPSPRRVIAFSPSMNTGCSRRLTGAGQADAEVGVFALARAVDDAAHHGHLHVFDARVACAPDRHGGTQEVVDLFRQFLERGAGGAATTGAGGDTGHEGTQPQRLKNLRGHHDLLRARFARLRRERDADGVADALLQQHGQRRRRCHGSLGAHAGFGQTQVQHMVGAAGQLLVHRDQVLHARDLAGQHDVVAVEANLFGPARGIQCRGDQRFVHHLPGIPGLGTLRVVVHQTRQQVLVQAAPVDADADRLVPAGGNLDHLGKLPVTLVTATDVAGVDAVLGQRLGAGRVVGQQAVAVVVEIADQRHMHAHAVQLLADVRHGLRGLVVVDRDAHQLRTRQRQLLDLDRGTDGVRGVGVGHGLHAHRRTATHSDPVVAPGDDARTAQAHPGCAQGNGLRASNAASSCVRAKWLSASIVI